jgi:hypothetical protein
LNHLVWLQFSPSIAFFRGVHLIPFTQSC